MAKQRVELHELRDAKVSHLSMVDTGAARTPFKIQKAHEGGAVINMHTIFKDEAFQPRVLAVAVADGANLDQAKAVIEKAGLNTETPKAVEGATVFEQGDGALAESTGDMITVKVNKQLAAIVDVEKGFSPFSGSSNFSTNLQAEGFLPSMELSLEAFRTSVFNGLFDADDSSDAKSKVSKAAKDLASHIGTLVNDLPEEVFKLEAAQFDGDQTTKPSERDGVDSGSSADADMTAGEEEARRQAGVFAISKEDAEEIGLTDDQIPLIAALIQKAGISAQGVATGDNNPASPEHSPGAAATDGKSDQEDNGLVGPESKDTVDSATSSLGDEGLALQPTGVTKEVVEQLLTAQMDAITKLFEGVNSRLGVVEKAAEGAADVAKGAAKAVGSTVLGEAEEDSLFDRQEMVKSEPAFMDTGMQALLDE